MRTPAVALLSAALLFFGVACANPGAGPGSAEGDAPAKVLRSKRGQALKTIDGLDLVLENRRGTLYVRPDHNLGSYDTIRIEPFTLSYLRGQRPMSELTTERLGKHLLERYKAEIEENYVGVQQKADACTVSVQVHIAELELLDLTPISGGGTSFISSAGSVMLIMEMRDGLTGEALMRYGRRRTLPGGKLVGGPGSLSTKGLGNALSSLMVDAGAELAQIMPTTTGGHIAGCKGLLFEATGRSGPAPADR